MEHLELVVAGQIVNCGNFISAYYGKKITSVELTKEDQLKFIFSDGSGLLVFDNDDQCCEKRYLHVDDALTYYNGADLLAFEIRDGQFVELQFEVHQTQFLLVHTSKGVFTVVAHNENNGEYCGFQLAFSEFDTNLRN